MGYPEKLWGPPPCKHSWPYWMGLWGCDQPGLVKVSFPMAGGLELDLRCLFQHKPFNDIVKCKRKKHLRSKHLNFTVFRATHWNLSGLTSAYMPVGGRCFTGNQAQYNECLEMLTNSFVPHWMKRNRDLFPPVSRSLLGEKGAQTKTEPGTELPPCMFSTAKKRMGVMLANRSDQRFSLYECLWGFCLKMSEGKVLRIKRQECCSINKALHLLSSPATLNYH